MRMKRHLLNTDRHLCQIAMFAQKARRDGGALQAFHFFEIKDSSEVNDVKDMRLGRTGLSAGRNSAASDRFMDRSEVALRYWPRDRVACIWPDGGTDKTYIVIGGPRTPESLAGWVTKNPVGAGEPMVRSFCSLASKTIRPVELST
jgi:hypothetical protein